jgi:hypothetical protein
MPSGNPADLPIIDWSRLVIDRPRRIRVVVSFEGEDAMTTTALDAHE